MPSRTNSAVPPTVKVTLFDTGVIDTPLMAVTDTLMRTPFCGLSLAPETKFTEAVPEISVIAVAALKEPLLGSSTIENCTSAFLTRLEAESRTTAEIVELLLNWLVEPVLG